MAGQSALADTAVITTFAKEERGLDWFVVNDDVMGGRSQSAAGVAGGKLTFSGTLNTNGGGFASVRTAPEPLELSTFDGVRLRVRGDGRIYKFRLTTDESRVSYMAPFTTQPGEWLEVNLDFGEFLPSWRGRRLDRPPVNPAAIDSVGFMLSDRRDGPFQLEVDWIQATRR